MTRVLLTGGAGFIGSHVAERLVGAGDHVLVVDDLSTGSSANLEPARALGGSFALVAGDICDLDLGGLVTENGIEAIVHLAAQASVARSVVDPLADAMVNVIGTVRLLEAARLVGARVVYAASGGTLYGEVPADDLPVTEDRLGTPVSPYGISKRAGLDYLSSYGSLFGLHTVGLALANVFGPRQSTTGEAGVVAAFVERACLGLPARIEGDGGQTRDFVYVGDVAEAFALASAGSARGLFNVGTGRQTSVVELHRLVGELAGAAIEPTRAAGRVGDVRASALDPARAARELGWTPRTSLADGLAQTIAAMRAALVS